MYFVHPQIHPVKSFTESKRKSPILFNRVKLNHLWRAVSSLFRKPDLEKLNQKLSSCFPEKQLIFTDMGRSAFKLIIKKLNLENSEILLPAYLCDIFYPILKSYNIKPVFLDIDLETFSVPLGEIEKRVSIQTKAILACHTYGLPTNIQKIREVVGNQLLIIEDCAHSFGANTGNLGEIAFFSLYKQFSALRGGLLVCPKAWEIKLPRTSFNFRDFISFLNCFPFFALFFKKFGARAAPKMLRKEKLSEPAGINRVSLNLFSDFLGDFEKSLARRKKLALFFQAELKNLGFEVQGANNNVFCYLSVLVPRELEEKRDKIVQGLKKYKVFCTRIWHTPIVLNEDVQKEYNFSLSDFPNTVEAAKRIINFPLQNHYTERDILKMVSYIQRVIHQL